MREEIKARWINAKVSGLPVNFNDLLGYHPGWLKVVSDVAFVMEEAQRCNIPTEEVLAKRKGRTNPEVSSPIRAAKKRRETDLATSCKKPTSRKRPKA